ncbi:MAG: LamG domain-containing protein [Leptospirales bacterium]|nr:LamG domain-containing protein [Leptospirales bacterium]
MNQPCVTGLVVSILLFSAQCAPFPVAPGALQTEAQFLLLQNISSTGTGTTQAIQSGMFGSAFGFNGTTSYVDVDTSGGVPLGPPLTIEAFVKTTGSGTYVVYQAYGGIAVAQLSITPAGNVSFLVVNNSCSGSTTLVSTGALTPGVTYHIAAVWTAGNQMRIYINGSVDPASMAGPALTCSSTNQHSIGRDRGGFNYFNGSIDEIRYSNIARYSANFSVPTAPFVADANTSLLFHLDSLGFQAEGSTMPVTSFTLNGITLGSSFVL